MKIVLIFGSFDLIHEGHRDVFRQAKNYGEVLHVVLARDETIFHLKGKLPLYSAALRKEMLEKENGVDVVHHGDLLDKYKTIRELRPDVIVLGYDQHNFTESLQAKLDEYMLATTIVRATAFFPEKYKSSLLKAQLIEKK